MKSTSDPRHTCAPRPSSLLAAHASPLLLILPSCATLCAGLFHEIREPALSDAWFDAKPMVLLVGQYSVGKTSFIKYLLGRSFPNQHIGPEPTTDRFVAVMYGDQEKVTPGNALTSQPDTPFHSLRAFGANFLNKLEAALVPAPILRRICLVDSPGVQVCEPHAPTPLREKLRRDWSLESSRCK